jgi:alpha-D-ribose 1-methylphosphonate 5-triphosphate diphosphatase
MSRVVWANVTAVTPDHVLEDAVVVAKDGLIVDVGQGSAPPDAIDLGGSLLIPGIIDTHSDALERYAQPRPGARIDADLALLALEGSLRSAGVTTVFHGVAFEENRTWSRSLDVASQSLAAIVARRATPTARVDHRVLHRLDARNDLALEMLERTLDEGVDTQDAVPLVSFEDHTPGQGQFTDIESLARVVASYEDMSEETARQTVLEHREEREANAEQYWRSLGRLSQLASSGDIRLVVHDPTHRDQVHDFRARGARVAEFPCTIEAAEAAKSLDMPIVAGAPNVLIGKSHSGNIAATDLVGAQLCDGLASDYFPHGLLGAAFALVESGVVDLPTSIALITSGPARVVGLDDRGILAPGYRADVVAVDSRTRWPTVLDTWVQGRAGHSAVRQS